MKFGKYIAVLFVMLGVMLSTSCGDDSATVKKTGTKKTAGATKSTVKKAVNKKNPLLAYVSHKGNRAVISIVNSSRHLVDIQQDVNNKFIKENIGNLKVIESIYSKDQTKPAPKAMVDSVINGKFGFALDGYEYLIIVVEKKE